MNMSVLCRDLELVPPERRVLESSARQLQRFFHRIGRVEWSLEASRGTHLARCRLHSRSGYYGALGSGRDMARAMRDALRKLVAQRRRRKAARTRARRAPRTVARTKVWSSPPTLVGRASPKEGTVHGWRARAGAGPGGVAGGQRQEA